MNANAALVNAARQACVNCATRAPLNAPPEKLVYRLPLWRRATVWPLAALVRLWAMTIRMSIPRVDRENLTRQGEPILFVLWHNRLFIAAEITRRYRAGHPIYGMVSASRDGAWLAAFFSACGMRAVRGSSSRLGREAVKDVVEQLRSGNDVGITPDGPRGPAYEMKPGAVIVARRAQATVLLVGMDYEASWRLPSWDGFHIPKPFSRVHLRFMKVDPKLLEDREDAVRGMETTLAALNPDRKPAPVRKPA